MRCSLSERGGLRSHCHCSLPIPPAHLIRYAPPPLLPPPSLEALCVCVCGSHSWQASGHQYGTGCRYRINVRAADSDMRQCIPAPFWLVGWSVVEPRCIWIPLFLCSLVSVSRQHKRSRSLQWNAGPDTFCCDQGCPIRCWPGSNWQYYVHSSRAAHRTK